MAVRHTHSRIFFRCSSSIFIRECILRQQSFFLTHGKDISLRPVPVQPSMYIRHDCSDIRKESEVKPKVCATKIVGRRRRAPFRVPGLHLSSAVPLSPSLVASLGVWQRAFSRLLQFYAQNTDKYRPQIRCRQASPCNRCLRQQERKEIDSVSNFGGHRLGESEGLPGPCPGLTKQPPPFMLPVPPPLDRDRKSSFDMCKALLHPLSRESDGVDISS